MSDEIKSKYSEIQPPRFDMIKCANCIPSLESDENECGYSKIVAVKSTFGTSSIKTLTKFKTNI